MDLLFFINSFQFIMPILLSLLFISVLEKMLAMIHHIKGWKTFQSIKLGKKASSPSQEQQLQNTELWHSPKIGIWAENINRGELFGVTDLIQAIFPFSNGYKFIEANAGIYTNKLGDRNWYTARSRPAYKENLNFSHVLVQCYSSGNSAIALGNLNWLATS